MTKFLMAALLAGVASSAMAADLPTRKAPPAPAQVYAPVFTWTGFYAGVNGGWGWASPSSSNFKTANGGLLGAQAGYNYQVGQFVGGVEADADWTYANSKNNYAPAGGGAASNSFKTGFMTTERLRAGVVMDRALIFVTGGYAGIQTNASFVNGGVSGSQSAWRNGGVIGAGLEYAFTNNISAKAEYLYAPMSSQSYFGGTTSAESSSLNLSIIRAGLNYKF